MANTKKSKTAKLTNKYKNLHHFFTAENPVVRESYGQVHFMIDLSTNSLTR